MRIDSHQHFWQYSQQDYPWIDNEMKILQQDYLPQDLAPLLDAYSINGCIAVQAAQSAQDTQYLLDLQQKYDFIKGVVGWIDLLSGNAVKQMDEYSRHTTLKGFRHPLQSEPAGFMLNEQFIRGVSALGTFNYTYDILITESQLKETVEFVSMLPDMQLVVDHLAKPDIRHNGMDHWMQGMKALSAFPFVYLKLSGLITEADWTNWTVTDIAPFVDIVLEYFGPDRLMYGSDWPVCLLAGNYSDVYNALDACINQLTESEQKKIMGLNASFFYNL